MSYYSPNKGYLGSTLDRSAPIYDRPYNRGGYYNSGPFNGSQYYGGYNRGEQWSEYIPVEQRYTDYIPETKVEYRPIEKSYTDYIEVKHETDYVPVPRLERRVEYIPVDRYEEHVDYMPVQSTHVVKTPSQGPVVSPPPYVGSSYVGGAYGAPYGGYTGGYSGAYSGYQSRYNRPSSLGGYSGYGYRYL